MKFFTKKLAGQSILSWVFQLALIYVAWQVSTNAMPNNITTITIAAVLLLAIYWSFSLDRRSGNNK
ncbi:hypothetical protein ABC628_01110 [Lentilactobacillus otakiensis]|uniref:Uncharacterized protein n=1 Tax=Lentilactobacillus otakiensis DSM 19908 = JCM 15040 TaxID=1423780 RepID=S4NUY9_9LACO|nr:hypothetical protein [Lentilactobacillus otakiensis]KRL10501.1 hypothetical protein FD05_GL000629 [Lentilactobacillus otakiensis DSM 19908 = JCM 15040]MBZ3775506.1 hypothetical protein [Lentilactobacillus otakiensis]MDV3518191.1 hypothetical protein [Lentilactobacillus otakiensis]GAD17743.1 hypothetical protein LOT_2281 [Lentilactobacillus otakiensis DSM 19908 = JCM 15040]